MEAAIRYLAGYLNGTVDHSLAGVRMCGVDVIVIDSYADVSHHGAKAMHSQSQTGLMIMFYLSSSQNNYVWSWNYVIMCG